MNSLCELDIIQPIKTTCVCRHQCASTSFKNLLQTNWTNSKTVCWVHKVCLPLCFQGRQRLEIENSDKQEVCMVRQKYLSIIQQ